MFEKSWRYRTLGIEENETEEIAKKLNIPTYIASLLNKRGIYDENEMRVFLDPTVDGLIDPMKLKDIGLAIERILQAADDGEKVTIFGDYDADGITSTAVLYHFLSKYLEMNIDFYIPDRLSEGYGMSMDAVSYLASKGTNLIITVDCGIMCHAEIDYAYSLGIDVVVTDHHKCAETLPKCCAVVNPTRPDCEFPYKTLAGVGVVFKLISAIGYTIGVVEEIYNYLPIVAIGTIGDSMPITGDNRVIVKNGLEYIQKRMWVGLDKLIEMANRKNSDISKLTSTDIAFYIVPVINAAGRMGDAGRAIYLLLTEDEEAAISYTNELIAENVKRKEVEALTTKEAVMPNNLKTDQNDSVVISVGQNWHHGVIGIVSSRLSEKFNKPSIVLTFEEGSDKYIRGSARSVEGFNMHMALTKAAKYITKFGGHEMAAGLTMEVDNVPYLIEELNKYAKTVMDKTTTVSYYDIDEILEHEDITLSNAKLLQLLEPFGQGNESPLFCATNLKVRSCAKIGKDKHLRINFVTIQGQNIQGVAFNAGAYSNLICNLDNVSVLFKLEVNSYNNTENVSLFIEDILDDEFKVDKLDNNMYNTKYRLCNCFTLCRNDMLLFYKVIKTAYGEGFTFSDLNNIRQILLLEGFTWFKIRKVLDVFIELGIIIKNGKGIYSVDSQSKKVELEASTLYRTLCIETE